MSVRFQSRKQSSIILQLFHHSSLAFLLSLDLNIKYGYAIPEVSGNVQERVHTAIETMTGLEVGTINVRIASVDMGDKKR